MQAEDWNGFTKVEIVRAERTLCYCQAWVQHQKIPHRPCLWRYW
uniref:Transposase n=1 Tax=Heterorhabditis bacteriophora TaxID=37862 RepID=A0A1I7XSC0_HETBA